MKSEAIGKSQTVVGWKDNRVVLVMTLYFDNAVEDVSRTTTNCTETFSKPTAIIQYTKCMGGVDRRRQKRTVQFAATGKRRKEGRRQFIIAKLAQGIRDSIQGCASSITIPWKTARPTNHNIFW